MSRTWNALFLVGVLSIHSAFDPTVAAAQDAYACIDRLTDDEVSYRLRHIVNRFEKGKRASRAWWYGWTAFSLGAAALTWTMFSLREDRADRDPAFIGGVGSGLLFAQQAALPLVSAFAPQRLRRMPEDTPEQRRAKLHRATRLLERAAGRERLLSGISAHAGGMVYGLVGGIWVSTQYDNVLGSLQAWLGPPIIAEAKVLTLPHQAYYDWEHYRSFACAGVGGVSPSGRPMDAEPPINFDDDNGVVWSIAPSPFGLGLRVIF